jgi:hypothetical protein
MLIQKQLIMNHERSQQNRQGTQGTAEFNRERVYDPSLM